jgi:hypothetical protein
MDATQHVIIAGYKTCNIYDASAEFTAGAAATDVFAITGATGKLVRIFHISLTGIQTTSGVIAVSLLKRSTANSGGTSAAVTAVKQDSTIPAASATVLSYTANPTTGTLTGAIQYDRIFLSDASSPKSSDSSGFLGDDKSQRPIAILRAGETLAINLAGQTVSGNILDAHVRWEECVAP